MYKIIFTIIGTIHITYCIEPEPFTESWIREKELAEQLFFGIPDCAMQKTSDAQQKNENKLLALRDQKLKIFLATMFNDITKKETTQEKLPLMMQVAAKLSGYNAPIHKTARINYSAINTDEYKSRLKKCFFLLFLMIFHLSFIKRLKKRSLRKKNEQKGLN